MGVSNLVLLDYMQCRSLLLSPLSKEKSSCDAVVVNVTRVLGLYIALHRLTVL